MNTIVFEDEIVLYWDKHSGGAIYRITLDCKEIARTEKTHYELIGLSPKKDYHIRVELIDKDGVAVKTLFCDTLTTLSPRKRIDVTKQPYCAVGDGKTLNTKALQRAFDDCKAGESVYIPSGTYITGALNMHSDTELFIDEGAILQGTCIIEDYAPKKRCRFEGIETDCYRALINIGEIDHCAGYTSRNVVIRGGGTVSGGGKELCTAFIESERERLKEFLAANKEYVKTCENENTIPGRARPMLVDVCNCENVIFSNVKFSNGPAWNLHMVYCKDIVTYNCHISSDGVWNGDGWDPDSSENCTIFGVKFNTHDDAIAIKSGKNPEGNVIDRPTRNVRIFDCRGKNGISLGSELSGGIENVFIWDCDFFNAFTGFRIKTTRKRGGYVRNLRIDDCLFADVRVWTKYYSNDDGDGADKLTQLKDFRFENIEIAGICIEGNKSYSVPAMTLMGFDDNYIENVTLSNIKIHKKVDDTVQKLVIEDVKNLTVGNISSIDD